jgi:hypothetical protein
VIFLEMVFQIVLVVPDVVAAKTTEVETGNDASLISAVLPLVTGLRHLVV